jgi:hypothetical protein
MSRPVILLKLPSFNSIYLVKLFNQTLSFVYKYFCVSENKSVIKWTFCQLLGVKPNCKKQMSVVYLIVYTEKWVTFVALVGMSSFFKFQ